MQVFVYTLVILLCWIFFKIRGVKPRIYIYWPDLMDSTEVTRLIRKYKDTDVWVQEYYDFFKNMIVGEVKY